MVSSILVAGLALIGYEWIDFVCLGQYLVVASVAAKNDC